MPRIGAIVLAAGGSSRLGEPKQLLVYEGQSFLRRVARIVVDAGAEPVLVVLGSQHDEMAKELDGLHVELAINSQWERGIGSSIRCGVHRLMEMDTVVDAALLCLCDQPMITRDVLTDFIRHFSPNDRPICVSSFGDTIGPPVIVSARYFPDLLSLRDDQGAKSIWLNRPDLVHRVPCSAAQIDVDTIDDYRRLADEDARE